MFHHDHSEASVKPHDPYTSALTRLYAKNVLEVRSTSISLYSFQGTRSMWARIQSILGGGLSRVKLGNYFIHDNVSVLAFYCNETPGIKTYKEEKFSLAQSSSSLSLWLADSIVFGLLVRQSILVGSTIPPHHNRELKGEREERPSSPIFSSKVCPQWPNLHHTCLLKIPPLPNGTTGWQISL